MGKKLFLCLVIISSLALSGCFIKGRVVDENGNGVAGITVALSGDASATTTTNKDGYYQFGSSSTALDDGNYTITPAGDVTPASKVVTLANRQPKSGVDFVISTLLFSNEAKLLPSDGAPDDVFGCSVAISGNYAIVGAHHDDDNGPGSGSAYIFELSGGNWIQMAKLTASDGATYDNFGGSVAISGNYAIIGAYLDDDNGENSGSAYIYELSGGNWIEMDKLTASDGAANDHFGGSVAISGNYAIVSAAGDDYDKEASGSAYIYELSGGNWVEMDKLTHSDGEDWFGSGVAISGNYAIVGAFDIDDYSGSAHIYELSGGNWIKMDKLTAGDGATNDEFGSPVGISGNYAIVGAHDDDNNGEASGSAYIYELSGGNWIEMDKLTADDGAASLFGTSVAISGNYAIVGAYLFEKNGDSSGSAYVYELIDNSWIQTNKLTPDYGPSGNYVGTRKVSISGNYAIVSANNDDDNGPGSGSAYIFYPD